MIPPQPPFVQPTVAVTISDPRERERALALAHELGLPLLQPGEEGPPLQLSPTPAGLELRQRGRGAPGPLRIDFAAGAMAHRRRAGGGRRQPLARAVGLGRGRAPVVLDVTAGLGRDAFVLASLGATVRMVERSPVVWALLRDALERATRVPELAAIMERMTLIRMDARDCLAGLPAGERPDVVYLDPMYPHRNKSALVKKEMRLFRMLVGDDEDAAGLLELARSRAVHRVVVKRPARGGPLGDSAPDGCVRSPNTRYDLYINRGFGDPAAGA